jgi:autotransporter-associated beta strand protein
MVKISSLPGLSTLPVQLSVRPAPGRSRLSWLVATTALVGISAAGMAPAFGQTVVNGNQTLSGTINGNSGGGFVVQSGTLTINTGTVSGFVTTGGAGSGGGAGLGGAILVEQGATTVLNNVNFANNTAAGGEGGEGSVGGTLDHLAAGNAGASGVAGAPIDANTSVDPNGYPGNTGTNGGAGTNGPGGTGGAGGPGTDGGSENPLLITQVAADSGAEVADTALEAYYTQEFAELTAAAAAALADPLEAGLAADLGAQATAAGVELAAATAELTVATTTLADDTAQLGLWDQALANGQLGIGGSGGDGGLGGSGDYGQGGGTGGDGGSGGTGGANWSGSAYQGGAAGGNGGQGGSGGDGGFGAGGGSGGDGGAGGQPGYDERPAGEQGQAGGGGQSGFGAGYGSTGNGYDTAAGGGGGGSGFGGSLFVQTGGTLDINGYATFNNDNVIDGQSANGGASGQAVGTDLFIMHGATVNLAPSAGNYVVFNGTIADDSAASIGNTSVAIGQGGGLTIDGASSGVVEFNNINTYTGTTKIVSGVLQAQDGTNIDANSNIDFEGGVLQSYGTFTRYLGTASNDVQWGNENGNNGGGFSGIGGGLTVTLNGDAQLSWGNNNFVTGTGATLDFGSTTAGADVNFTNAVSIGGGVTANIAVTANANDSDYAIMSGVWSGAGGLKIGNANQTGVLEFTGKNTYAGGTEVAGGTLDMANGSSLDSNGSMQIDSAASFDISGADNQSIGNLTGAGTAALGGNTLTLNLTGNAEFDGVVQDGGLSGGSGAGLTVNNATETLTDDNTYTGKTTIDSGAGIALAGGGSVSDSSVVVDNGTFDISADTNDTANIISLAGNGGVTLGESTLKLTDAADIFAGDMSGLGNVEVEAGDETFTGGNEYTGQTTVDNGATLALSGNGGIANSYDVMINGLFDISQAANGGSSIVDLNGNGSVTLGANTLTLENGMGAFNGVISGTGGLTNDNALEALTGDNTYTGATNIANNAVLVLAMGGSIALSKAVDDNGILDISTVNPPGSDITTLLGNGTVSLGNNTLTLTDASTEFDGNIQDSGNLDVAAGAETLGAETDYTGSTTVDSGATLALTGAGSIAQSDEVNDNGTFDISAADAPGSEITTLLGNGTVALGGNTLTLTDASTGFAGGISGTGGVTVSGGDETLSGVNSYTGDTVIDNGTSLLLAGAGAIADSAAVTDDGVFDISADNAPGADITTLNGQGTVTLGSNTLTLTAANDTFGGQIGGAGGIEVAAGEEALSGENGFTGNATVDAGATLDLVDGGSVADAARVDDNGIFDISAAANGGSDIISLAGNGGVTLGANTLTLTQADDYFGGDASGTGNLTVAAGDEALYGVNDFTGHATVDAGATLALAGAGSIAVANGVTDNGNFDISDAADGGSDITTLNGDGTVALGENTLSLTAANDTFDGVIGGAGNLHVAAGAETLTGVNTMTGAATVDPGATLALSGLGSIAASAGVNDNGIFDISAAANGGSSIKTLAGDGATDLGANTLTLTDASTIFAGIAGGSGGVTVTGGTQTLTGVNTYTGETNIAAGAELALADAGSIAASSGVADDGVFDISQSAGGSADITTLSGNGSVNLGANQLQLTAADDMFAGVIHGTGGLTMLGGQETLTGTNTYTGTTDIQSGTTLALSGIGGIADSQLVTDDGVFDISAAAKGGAAITTLDGGGAVALGANTLTLTKAANNFAGSAAGTGGLHIAAGDETLSGVNTYTGETTLDAKSILALSGDGAVAESAGVVDNGTFDIGATTSGADITTLSGLGKVALGAKTLTLTKAKGDFAGSIGGTGGLSVAAGDETLSGAESYAGTTGIAAGATLALTGAGSIAASRGVAANGVFDIAATPAGATITTLSGNGSVTLGAETLTLANASTSFGGAISGTGGLTVAAGEQTLTGNNPYTGVTSIAAGARLILTGNASIGASSDVIDNGVFDISGENDGGTTVNALTGDGSVDVGADTLNVVDETGTFDGTLTGTGSLNIEGGKLTLPTLANNTPYQGQVNVNNSTATVTQNSANELAGPVNLNNGTLNAPEAVSLAQNISVTGNSTINGPAMGGESPDGSDSATLTGDLSGSGILNTTGNVIDNGSGGATGGGDVQSGTFEVGDANHPNTVFDGNFMVGNGRPDAILRGHGTIDGDVTNTGNVFPGGSIGTLTITGNYKQEAKGELTIEVTPDNTRPGITYDRLAVGGKASIAGTLALQVDPVAGQYVVGKIYTGVLKAGSLTGQFSTLADNAVYPLYMSLLPVYTPTDVNLRVTASTLAYHSGNVVLDDAYTQSAAQFGAMGSIFDNAPDAGSLNEGVAGSWATGGGSVGHANGDSLSGNTEIAGQGFRASPNITLGFAYAHMQTTTQGAQQQVTGGANGFYGYGMVQSGPWGLAGLAGGGSTSLTTKRQLSPLGLEATGSQSEGYYDGALQLRYMAPLAKGYLMPFARIGFTSMNRRAFAENGAGNLDIAYGSHGNSLTAITAGMRTSFDLPQATYDLQPWATLSGTEYAGDTNISELETIGLTTATETSHAGPGAAANIGAGVTATKNAWSGSLAYQGQIAGASQVNSFNATVTYRW